MQADGGIRGSPVDEQSGMDALIGEMQRINRLIALKVSRF